MREMGMLKSHRAERAKAYQAHLRTDTAKAMAADASAKVERRDAMLDGTAQQRAAMVEYERNKAARDRVEAERAEATVRRRKEKEDARAARVAAREAAEKKAAEDATRRDARRTATARADFRRT
jgi:hypothetical protein